MRQNFRIAIQKEGRLKEPSLKFLNSLGLKFKKTKKGLILPCQNNIEILFVRHADIPQYVQYGAADFGICGENLLYENNFQLRVIKKLGFGKCQLVIAIPKNSDLEKISELEEERIATAYPNSLRKFLKKQKINAVIIEIKGTAEIAPALGLADAICDLMQTGRTLRENNLKPIFTILKSEAILIESPFEKKEKFDFYEKILYKKIKLRKNKKTLSKKSH